MTSTDTSTLSDDSGDKLVGVPKHPLAAAAGAVIAGGATGAVVGTAAGPVGTVVGAVVGAIAGGLGGDAIASSFNQAGDDDHWRQSYSERPYVPEGSSYEAFRPAYAYGADARLRYPDGKFDEIESSLSGDWEQRRGESPLAWEQARPAVRDAWDRFDSSPRGDAGR